MHYSPLSSSASSASFSSSGTAPKAGQKQFITSLSLSASSFGGGDPLAARLAATAAASQPDPDAESEEDEDVLDSGASQGVRRHRTLSGAGRPKAGDIDSEAGFAHSSVDADQRDPLLSQLRYV
jgi:hypothetical protein